MSKRSGDSSIPLTTRPFELHFDEEHPGGMLQLSDGVRVRMAVTLMCRITNPYEAVVGLAGAHFMDILAPHAYSLMHQIVEGYSIESVAKSRRKIETLLLQGLHPKFRERGVELEAILIGSLEALHGHTVKPKPAEDILQLRPSFWGIGIDLKALWRRIRRKPNG